MQFVTYRVRAVREVPTPNRDEIEAPESRPAVAIGVSAGRSSPRTTGSSRRRSTCWEELAPGETIDAPAIVEGAATSIVVPPGWTAVVDSMRNIVLET